MSRRSCLLILGFAKNAAAALAMTMLAVATSNASTANELEDWLANHVQYSNGCEGGASEVQLRNLFSSTVREGFRNLSLLNHGLVADRLLRASSRDLRVTCEMPTLAGRSAQFEFAIPLLRPVAILRLGALLNGTRASAQLVKSLILHEVLHFMAFDNFSRELHNSTDFLSHRNVAGNTGAERDVVYACATAAFFPPVTARAQPQTAPSQYMRPVVARATCGSARVINGRVVVP